MFDPRSLASGATVPAVDPENIKRFRERQKELFGARDPAEQVAMGTSVFEEACTPGADVVAVWFRCELLELGLQDGILTDWQHGDELDDVLLQAIATFPFKAVNVQQDGSHQLNLREFYEELQRGKADQPAT